MFPEKLPDKEKESLVTNYPVMPRDLAVINYFVGLLENGKQRPESKKSEMVIS